MSSESFAWLPEYECGIRVIDADHHQLFDLVAELNERAAGGTADDDLSGVIERLIHYVNEHFAREERIMAAAGFPEFDSHILDHHYATDVIYAVRDLYRHDRDSLDLEKVAKFFRDWLREHILGNDRQYIPYVRGEKKGVQPQTPTREPVAAGRFTDFASLTLHVPPSRTEVLRGCAAVLSRDNEAADRLIALIDELMAGPDAKRMAIVAEKFKK